MFLTADRIHNGHKWLPEKAAIELSEDGRIIAIHENGHESAMYYEGVIAPGFVNAHCHLELSHMKGIIPQRTGLIPFLQHVIFHRNDFNDGQKLAARQAAYNELLENGVVAIGDIANGTDTLDLREKKQLHVHTFVECIGFSDDNAQQRFDFSKQVFEEFAKQKTNSVQLRQSIVPHAPYSVSQKLFRLIDAHQKETVISVHNQETEDENKFYIDKSGKVNDLLNSLKIDASFFQPSGKSSLKTYIEWLTPQKPVIFIHNTFTDKEDLHKAQAHQYHSYWCLCPNANLYIENTLPDVPMLVKEGADICIGTDSLASNHQLSILDELVTLKRSFPQLEWEQLLQWATFNGAQALSMQDEIGAIEPGKNPGILQLKGLDSGKATVTRIA